MNHTDITIIVTGYAILRVLTIPRPYRDEQNDVLGLLALGGE